MCAFRIAVLVLVLSGIGLAQSVVEGVVRDPGVNSISGAAIVLGRRAVIDVPTGTIFLVVLTLLIAVKKLPEPIVIVAAGVTGLALKGFRL